MFDRVDHAARGRDGGGAGANGRVELADGTPLRAKGRQLVRQGQRLRLSLPGGGGYGDPLARVRSEVADDLAKGYVTDEQAKSDYGYEE